MRFNSFILSLFVILLPLSIYSQKSDKDRFDLFYPTKNANDGSLVINDLVERNIREATPRIIEIPLWVGGQKKQAFLKKRNILSKNYRLVNAQGNPIPTSPATFYYGFLKEDESTQVSMTVSKDDITLSMYHHDELMLLEKDTKGNYHFNLQKKIPQKIYGECTSGEDSKIQKRVPLPSKNYSEPNDEEGILVYFEADHDLYKMKSSSIALTEFYVHLVFLQVAQIYANEQIDIKISEIKVWDTPDPYDKTTTFSALNTFQATVGANFNGHLAHLLSGNDANHGGRAEIDELCNKEEAHAYSNLIGNYQGISDFSWDPFVIAHEMGHNFGSNHTHDCMWGPSRNQVLDDCANITCSVVDNADPNIGGTIMSYCHRDNRGVSFAEGFGMQPGDTIRERYIACIASEGYSCETAIEITENGKFIANRALKGYGALQTNADHAIWYKFTAPHDGKIKVFNCQSGVDSRLWIHSGQCGNFALKAQSDDSCGNGGPFDYSSSIPQLNISAGETIYLEWDDRWSEEDFDFYFKYGKNNS